MEGKIIIALTVLLAACSARNNEMKIKPERISRSATIVLNAPIEKVFPLFGPVREKEWAEGWNPEIIYSEDAEIEEHMIFKTRDAHAAEKEYTWMVTQFSPLDYLVEYTVSTPQRIWFIRVTCESFEKQTSATVTYTYTGLSDEGNNLNREALEKMYAHDLKDWEEAINHYLSTGKQLATH